MPFLDPVKALTLLGIEEGMVICDFGAGSGVFAHLLSKRTGPYGRVYAIDINKDLLQKIKREGSKNGVHIIETVWADFEKPHGSKLREKLLDRALLANTLFLVEDKKGAIEEVTRVLKPNGRVLVIDWTESHGGLGPHPDQVIDEATVRALCEDSGLTYLRHVDVGSYHYGMIFSKL